MPIKTADLYDAFPDEVAVAAPVFQNFGGARAFGGRIATVRVFEDNVLVRETLATEGRGRVLVVDGGGSLRCALMGDRLAGLAHENGWAGVVLYGCIRDAAEVAGIDLGVKALHTCPVKSRKKGEGDRDVPVTFAGITFEPGHYVYGDEDGLLTAPRSLLDG